MKAGRGSAPPSAPGSEGRTTSQETGRPPRPRGASGGGAGNVHAASIARFAHRCASVYFALLLALFVEFLAVGVLGWRELAGPYELGRMIRALWPLSLLAVFPITLALAGCVELVRTAERRGSRLGLAGIKGLAGAAVGYGLGGGRHLSGGRRWLFAAALAAFGAVLATWLSPYVSKQLRVRSWLHRAGILSACAAAFVLFEVLDARVLPRLYPAFHLGMAGAALACAALATLAFDGAGPSRPGRGAWLRLALVLPLFALGAALTPPAAKALSLADNIRLVVHDHGPLLGRLVELAARFQPPAPLDETPLVEAKIAGKTLDLRDRDVLLVTIDALRADHVGAYGYGRRTTPNLDRLAMEGAVFERAYTPTPHTSYAITSLMTGKYMRPLALQGLGTDSETWADHLRRYGYRTAAFYPPAVFFIDADRFGPLRERALDFEYRKIEFASAEERVAQLGRYLDRLSPERRAFVWVHLFEPHEPYVRHQEFGYGDRDVDRYDEEVAAADRGLGQLVEQMRQHRKDAVVIVAADHGEEFGDHGGRYHGTTVYEEQVRVPLVVSAPGRVQARRIRQPVQLIDLLPTVLSALDVPRPARLRGNDLGPLLTGAEPEDAKGFAFAETDEQTMIAQGARRLVCARALGACALYHLGSDPLQLRDVASDSPSVVAELRAELRRVDSSHGRYELRGLRQEGKGWPEALRRGMAGDGEAATDIAALLDDADLTIRRKAAELLFELRRPEASAGLRLSMVRDEDDQVRRYAALALTRLGEGAPRTRELLSDADPHYRRLAALALAEAGESKGEAELIAWLRQAYPPHPEPRSKTPRREAVPLPFERTKQIIEALARLKTKAAVPLLCDALEDVRLRAQLARALASIGASEARGPLLARVAEERHQDARAAMIQALVKLGAGPELRPVLLRFLGTPDPLPGGLSAAVGADLLQSIGGPRERDLERLARFARSGVALGMVVHAGGNGSGVRLICQARSTGLEPGEIRVGAASREATLAAGRGGEARVPAEAVALNPARSFSMSVSPGAEPHEVFATLPRSVLPSSWEPGESTYVGLVLYATQSVAVDACALVPLADELPAPPPEPWTPTGTESDEGRIE